ncbi:hypothetical protein [Actinokineospora enzanensis]|uniref:hypothetical protein n=1 Tax=Actinokineospora enzanensis TaxID=155975 RepID=UPI0004767802|nr:hypothetical protein [Actinokineospora enzanensis]
MRSDCPTPGGGSRSARGQSTAAITSAAVVANAAAAVVAGVVVVFVAWLPAVAAVVCAGFAVAEWRVRPV